MENDKDYILEYLIIDRFLENYLKYNNNYFSEEYRETLKKLTTFYDKNNLILVLIKGNIKVLNKEHINILFQIRNFLNTYIYENIGVYFI